MRLLALIACTTALAFVAAACSGDDTESGAEWVESFCTLTRAWGEDLEEVASEMSSRSLSLDELGELATAARRATTEYVDGLRSLGPPEDAGDELTVALEDLAAEVEGEADEIEDAVDDAAGLNGVVTAAREIAASVAAMFTALERTLETFASVDDDELRTALEEADGCALGSG